MNVTQKPEISTFETDFGVTFGHFICFDILFKSPALDLINNLNVTHILYPTMWYSEIPFLTSVQIQQSFAERNNVVLLSAGANSPENSNTGSGIFVGKHGAVDKIISYKSESRMLIAEVPKDVNDDDYEPGIPSTEPYTQEEMNEMKLWKFVSKKTYPLTHHKIIELNQAECEFHLNYTEHDIYDDEKHFGFRLAAYSGTRSYEGIINAGELHCAIVSCSDPSDEDTCGQKVTSERSTPSVTFHQIVIKLNLHDDEEKNYLIMPTSLDTSILPLSSHLYQFKHMHVSGGQKYSMKSVQVNETMMTFGIYGRNFKLDNKNFHIDDNELDSSDEMLRSDDSEVNDTTERDSEDEVSDLQLKMSIYIVIMVVLSIITSIMVYRKLQTPYIKPDVNRRKFSIREI
jgi:pantetheine hydrolase